MLLPAATRGQLRLPTPQTCFPGIPGFQGTHCCLPAALLAMSTSTSCPIPGNRDRLPDGYSTTPGGTLYATTPGGQRAGQWGWGGADLGIASAGFSSSYSETFETVLQRNSEQCNSTLKLAFWCFWAGIDSAPCLCCTEVSGAKE